MSFLQFTDWLREKIIYINPTGIVAVRPYDNNLTTIILFGDQVVVVEGNIDDTMEKIELKLNDVQTNTPVA